MPPFPFFLIEKYHAALPVHAPLSASLTFKKVAHEKVRDTSKESEREREIMEREREEEDEGGRLSHRAFVQSRPSACCFGNVMSVQPLATPLRLASFSTEVCVSVFLWLSL